MSVGKITYAIKCDGFELKELEIPLEFDTIPSVTFETIDDGVLKATFKTNKIYNEAKARQIINPIIERLTDRLSFLLNIAVKKPYFAGSALPPDPVVANDGIHRLKVSSVIGLDAIIHAVIKPGSEKRKAIVDFLKRPPVTSDLLISEYALSISRKEHLSKFMLLYNLMLRIVGDEQKLVDDIIKRIYPNVDVVKSKRKSRRGIIVVEETIFTKLRNEVAHTRDGVSKQDTINQIKNNLPKFIEIVKEVIQSKLS